MNRFTKKLRKSLLCLLAFSMSLPPAFMASPAHSTGPFDHFGDALGYDISTAAMEQKDARSKRASAEAEALAKLAGKEGAPLFIEALVSGAALPASSAGLIHAKELNELVSGLGASGYHGHQHELDTYGLLRQDLHLSPKGRPKFTGILPDRLNIEVFVGEDLKGAFNVGGRDLSAIYGRRGNLEGQFALNQDQFIRSSDELNRVRFKITYQEHDLHTFNISLQAIGVVENFLVYLEPANIDPANKTALLSFVDLNFLEQALGAAKLPIFRLPIPLTDDELAAPNNLQLKSLGNGLHFGSHLISRPILDYFSTLQQMAFNTVVNLSDPRFYKDVESVTNDIFEVFVNGMKEKQRDLHEQFDRAGIVQGYVDRFVEALRTEIKAKAKMGPTLGEKKQEEILDTINQETLREIDEIILRNMQEAGVWDKNQFPDVLRLSQKEHQEFQRQALLGLNGKVPAALRNRIETVQRFAYNVVKEQNIQTAISEYAKWQSKRRLVTARLGLFWTRMTRPQPLGAPRIERALGIIAGTIIRQQDIRGPFTEAVRQIFYPRINQISAAMLVGAATAQVMPEAYAHFYANALSVGQQASEWIGLFWTHVANMWGQSWAGLTYNTIVEKVFTGDNPHRVLIGLGAVFATLLGYAGVVHNTVNGFLFTKAAAKEGYTGIRQRGANFISGLKAFFIEYTNTQKHEHLSNLALANKVRANSSVEVTQADRELGEKLVKEAIREDELNAGLLSRMRQWRIFRVFKSKNGEIKGIISAFRNFLLSEWSWTHTARVNGRMWNPWFLSRNIFFKARTWTSMIAYPNLFNRYVSVRKGGHFPTTYNGGKTSISDFATNAVIKMALAYDYHGIPRIGSDGKVVVGPIDNEEGLSPGDRFAEQLKDLEAWEKSVIPAEAAIQRAVINRTFQQLTAMAAKDPELLAWWSEVATDQSSSWITKATDSRLLNLPRKYKIYARAYQKELLERSLRAYFASQAGLDQADGLSEKEIKEAALANQLSPEISERDAHELVRGISQNEAIHLYAYRTAFDFTQGFWHRQKVKHLMKVERGLDPNLNYSLNRFVTAATKLKDPVAMARATRQFMISLITDKPQELLFTFLFALGIDQGLLVPIQDELMGDNSIAYLSRVLFWQGFLAGTLISLHADPWMKVQTDARMDELKALDDVPTSEEYKQGYWSWFKRGWKKKENSLWANYNYGLKLTFVNMPAYFLTALVTNMIFLGRFELDMFVNVYLGALLPLTGLAFKTDQTFEAASKFDFGRFPEKVRFTEAVQEYVNKKITRRKFTFNVLNNVWLNIEGMIMGNIMTGTTTEVGPRSFSRLVFAGMLPSEWLVNYVFRPLGKIGGIVEPAMVACEYFLTNKHTDAVKIPPREK